MSTNRWGARPAGPTVSAVSSDDRPDRDERWRPITVAPHEQHHWERAAAIGFGYTEPTDPWPIEQIEALERRAWAVEEAAAEDERGVIVGTSADIAWNLTLPGGNSTPVGAILAVTTRATHRRRGVLRSLMGAQLGAMASEGLAAAVLTASEGGIYGRFGFGVATSQHELVAPTGGHGLGHVPLGRIDLGEASEFRDEIVAFRQRVARYRPGTLSRPGLWWDRLVLGERRSFEGGGPQFVSLHRDADGQVDGYALWRLEGEFGERTVVVRELHALDPQVETALFRHCGEIDLSSNVRWDTAPADTPILAATNDPRRCRIGGIRDQLWLCPLDVAALLSSRTYAAPIDAVLRVDGDAAGWSAPTVTVRLQARPGEPAEVAVLDESPAPSAGDTENGRSGDSEPMPAGPATSDLACDRATLGMTILGTTPWRTLAAAGRVDVGDPDVLAIADAAFASHPAANSQDYF